MSAPFGSPIPYAEPPWYSRDSSPYYDDSHKKLREFVREYVENDLKPYAEDWEKQGFVPTEVSIMPNRTYSGLRESRYTIHYNIRSSI